jgi:hypothetical protein
MTKSTAIIFILGFALLMKLEEKVNIFTCGKPIENSTENCYRSYLSSSSSSSS